MLYERVGDTPRACSECGAGGAKPGETSGCTQAYSPGSGTGWGRAASTACPRTVLAGTCGTEGCARRTSCRVCGAVGWPVPNPPSSCLWGVLSQGQDRPLAVGSPGVPRGWLSKTRASPPRSGRELSAAGGARESSAAPGQRSRLWLRLQPCPAPGFGCALWGCLLPVPPPESLVPHSYIAEPCPALCLAEGGLLPRGPFGSCLTPLPWFWQGSPASAQL